jgi:carbonic anhydrase
MDRPAMQLMWGSQSGSLTNNEYPNHGRTVVFTLDTVATSVIMNKHYTLKECSFHWGSEHFVEGMQQRMEVHCMHEKTGHPGKWGAIGMFYNVGSDSVSDADNFVAQLLTQANTLPSAGEELQVQNLDLQLLVEQTDLQHFWSYDGSFTMPPCTEVVDWYVLMDHAVISSDQYDKFQIAIGLQDPEGGNFRPPQPLNGRYIDGCVEYNEVVDLCDVGTQQSPIDLDQCTHDLDHSTEAIQHGLSVLWGSNTVEIVSGTGELSLVVKGGKPTSVLKGTTYTLSKCNFRLDSDHTVNSKTYDLELQCVHEGYEDANNLDVGVVSIFFEVPEVGGSDNVFVSEIVAHIAGGLPHEEGIDFDNLWNFPKGSILEPIDRTKYWDYKGSSIAAPCTENVHWYVMMEPAQLSAEQLSVIEAQIGSAAKRGPQPLNERAIGGCVPRVLLYPYDKEHWRMQPDAEGNPAEVCATGSKQSPIDLTECSVRLAQPAITMDLGTQVVDVLNTGLTVQMSVTNPPPATMVGETAYTLRHCEFHWGSEHSVEHKQQRFEAQCVHDKVLDASLGVVALFFTLGSSDNLFFANFDDEDTLASTTAESQSVNFDLLLADVDVRHYWNYEGSLTRPPCTEVVDWYVMMDSSMLSSDQFVKFQSAIGWIAENGNFRPPQRLDVPGVVGCQDPNFVPAPTTTTTTPLPPYEEVHAGACMGGWLGNNLKTGSVNGCHLACLDMPACGYFSYNDIDNTCARYSPFQRCPEFHLGTNKYPSYRSYRENRNIFENPREYVSHAEVRAGPCASGWLSSQNARMDDATWCAHWCAGHLICRYFSFSQSSQSCSLYSAYSMCPARLDDKYANTDWMSYILYTKGEEMHPAAPSPEENLNFFLVHRGHCAAGWMSGHNSQVTSLEACIKTCFETPTCGYISYNDHTGMCSLYRGNARCPADNNYPDFVSYRIALV